MFLTLPHTDLRWGTLSKLVMPGMVMYGYILGTQEAEIGVLLQIGGQPRLQSEVRDNLNCLVKLFQKRQKKKKRKIRSTADLLSLSILPCFPLSRGTK